jgi:hypothetical protein
VEELMLLEELMVWKILWWGVQAGYSLLSIDETAKTALHYGARQQYHPALV